MQTEILRAYRFALDPTKTQLETLTRHAGAARWAFNHALGMKGAAHKHWRREVEALVEQGVPETEARKRVRVSIPSKPAIQKHLNQIKGDSRIDGLPTGALGPERPCPWWHEVNTYAFQSAMIDADRAWQNWRDSLTGKRAGRKVGYPRFKKKGRARDSFRLHHEVKRPGIRLVGYRRLRLPTIGEVRLHGSARELGRALDRDRAVVQSVTVSRAGHRWYASVLCKATAEVRSKPTRRQAERGTVGVDMGVKYLAALSQPLTEGEETTRFVTNPRHVKSAERRLTAAQRALSRTQKGSGRREKARRRVARLHHEVAERRSGVLHQLTKRMAAGFAVVAVEDLNVDGMARSAKGTVDSPGRRVRQKAGLNRAILDASLGEFRRQLAYKTSWYGSKLAVLDRWFPSSKTCSNCGWRNPSLTLSDRTFRCGNCESVMDRDWNAARNIARHAVLPDQPVACDRRETDDKNARGAAVSPSTRQGRRRAAMKREDTAPGVPPQRSDPLALPARTTGIGSRLHCSDSASQERSTPACRE